MQRTFAILVIFITVSKGYAFDPAPLKRAAMAILPSKIAQIDQNYRQKVNLVESGKLAHAHNQEIQAFRDANIQSGTFMQVPSGYENAVQEVDRIKQERNSRSSICTNGQTPFFTDLNEHIIVSCHLKTTRALCSSFSNPKPIESYEYHMRNRFIDINQNLNKNGIFNSLRDLEIEISTYLRKIKKELIICEDAIEKNTLKDECLNSYASFFNDSSNYYLPPLYCDANDIAQKLEDFGAFVEGGGFQKDLNEVIILKNKTRDAAAKLAYILNEIRGILIQLNQSTTQENDRFS